jgi:dihydroxy-acid dehydratase
MNPEVIRPIDKPFMQDRRTRRAERKHRAGGRHVVKRSAVVPEMLVHEGPATRL